MRATQASEGSIKRAEFLSNCYQMRWLTARPRKKLFYQIDSQRLCPASSSSAGHPSGAPVGCSGGFTSVALLSCPHNHQSSPHRRGFDATQSASRRAAGGPATPREFLGGSAPSTSSHTLPGTTARAVLDARPLALRRARPAQPLPASHHCQVQALPSASSWLHFSLDLLLPPNPTPAQHLGSTLGGRCLLARAAASMSWFPHIGSRQQEGDQHDLRGAGKPFNWSASSA